MVLHHVNLMEQQQATMGLQHLGHVDIRCVLLFCVGDTWQVVVVNMMEVNELLKILL
jgi:hypothetical protein